jgi:DNA-binding response OmpR family regulator
MTSPHTTVVIEDDLDIRLLVTAVLESAGYVVHAAATGLDGIELVRRHDPVVTTLDVSMPGIDGFETARRIRAFSDTRILMVSARADENEQRAGREAGADDYLTKPIRPRELRQRITDLAQSVRD